MTAAAPSELAIQSGLRQRLRHIAPGICLVAVPNGERRGQWALNRAMKEGMKPGFPDLLVFSNEGHFALVEVKAAKGRVDANQADWHARLTRWGFDVAVIRSVDEGEAFLRGLGFPFMVEAEAA